MAGSCSSVSSAIRTIGRSSNFPRASSTLVNQRSRPDCASSSRKLVYTAVHWTRLGVIHPVISYSTETIEIYAARRLAHVGAKLDPGEFLELLSWTASELDIAIDEGRVSDAKTVAARLMHERWTAAAQRSISVRISGRVQGVGYRDWLMRRAQATGVAGWVRNRRDGSVEALMQGPRDACDRLADQCVDGPRSAEVVRVEVARSAYERMQNTRFEQRPST